MVFVGPSGCGKTTTLRMIAGLEAVTTGDIRIDDTVVNEVPPMDRDIAMVFQNYALYPHMSVAANMAFGLKMRKFAKDEIEKRIKRAADDPRHRRACCDRKPRQLSGGQRQRVALGRAIVRDPKVFLFDEPLSNLDAKLRVQMRVELKKLHERLAATSIYVTHDQVEAMTLGRPRGGDEGRRVQQVGEPLELYNQPANRFVAGFIGSPAMNFADVTLAERAASSWPRRRAEGSCCRTSSRPRMRADERAGKAALGIRPENIHVAGDGDSADHCFEADVEVVEQLGSEILLDMRVGETHDGRERRADLCACKLHERAASWRSIPRACTSSMPRAKLRSDGDLIPPIR